MIFFVEANEYGLKSEVFLIAVVIIFMLSLCYVVIVSSYLKNQVMTFQNSGSYHTKVSAIS